jgi:uncharacterized protein YciI
LPLFTRVRGRKILGSSALLKAFATIGSIAPVGSVGKGGVVQIFTKYDTQETITDREKVMEVRQVGGKQLQEILQSGKVRASGVFADTRGGFFVLDVESAEEVFDLFSPVLDYIRIETHPLTTVEKLGEFLERDATGAAG